MKVTMKIINGLIISGILFVCALYAYGVVP